MYKYGKINTLNKTDRQYIEDRINKLFQRVLSYHRIDITNDDLRMLFVRPQHQELVKSAATELRLRNIPSFSFKINDTNVTVANQNNKSWVHPSYIGEEIYPYAAPEAYEEIEEWVRNRIEIGTEFSILMEAFYYLNRKCGTPRTMRYLWPALLGVCRPELADKVRDSKPPKELPAIPPEMMSALKQTEVTIAKAMMLPPKDFDASEQGITFYLPAHGRKKIELPWGGTGFLM